MNAKISKRWFEHCRRGAAGGTGPVESTRRAGDERNNKWWKQGILRARSRGRHAIRRLSAPLCDGTTSSRQLFPLFPAFWKHAPRATRWKSNREKDQTKQNIQERRKKREEIERGEAEEEECCFFNFSKWRRRRRERGGGGEGGGGGGGGGRAHERQQLPIRKKILLISFQYTFIYYLPPVRCSPPINYHQSSTTNKQSPIPWLARSLETTKHVRHLRSHRWSSSIFFISSWNNREPPPPDDGRTLENLNHPKSLT